VDARFWLYTFGASVIVAELMSRGILARFVWRELIRAFIILDLQALKVLQKAVPPRYVVRGGCQKRGLCCTQIVGNPPNFVKKSVLLKLFAVYHRVVHNFSVVGRGVDDSLIFRCGHLRSDGRCGIYRYRPLICRNYPVLPFYEAPPILPGCGYRVVLRELDKATPRKSLPIVNAHVAVHHPTPPRDHAFGEEAPEEFHLVDVS